MLPGARVTSYLYVSAKCEDFPIFSNIWTICFPPDPAALQASADLTERTKYKKRRIFILKNIKNICFPPVPAALQASTDLTENKIQKIRRILY